MRVDLTVGKAAIADVKKLAELVAAANHYNSRIVLILDNKKVNVKSIMGVLGCGLKAGDQIILEASGSDEEEAIAELTGFLG